MSTSNNQHTHGRTLTYRNNLIDDQPSSIKDSLNCTIAYQNNLTAINLGNCEQELYYITIGIGSPPQYFNFQFDTGSNVFWVPTIMSSVMGFNSSASSTFSNLSQPYQEDYVNGGKVSGSVGSDMVTLVNTSINVKCNIVFADSVTGLNLPVGIAGVIGMGFTSAQQSPNFLDLAYQQNQISTNTFALDLLNSSSNSQLLYNSIPQSVLKNSLSSPVVSNFYW